MQLIDELTAAEVEPNRWITEASMLRLPPGVFPRTLPAKIGNGNSFHLVHAHSDGSVFDYQQSGSGIWLSVLND